MSSFYESIAPVLLRELGEASEHLLDEGLSEGRAASELSEHGLRGPVGATLLVANKMRHLLPIALSELRRLPVTTREDVAWVREPRRAAPSRRPYDYAWSDGVLAPVTWELRLPEFELSASHLAWLRYGTGLLRERLAWHRGIIESAYSEAVLFSRGTRHGREEISRLEANRGALDSAIRAAGALEVSVRRLSDVSVRSSPRLPFPFPRTSAWRGLRAAIRSLADPSVMLPIIAADLNDFSAPRVDTPYLYQRWCGLKLVRSLERLGLRAESDPVPPLLLSGLIELRSQDHSVALLCEPRLIAGEPLEGLFAHGDTVCPDFVLISRRGAERRVYVLDPTTGGEEWRKDKNKYLEGLVFKRPCVVAGVECQFNGPDRSWAAAPIWGSTCKPSDWRGMHGIVPMHPLDFKEEPLLEWLRDLLRAG